MKLDRVAIVAKSIISALWAGQSPFGVITALWPTDPTGKYVISSEGIRLAFTNHGGALTNFWMNDTSGRELDIVLGFDTAAQYLNSSRNPYLGGAVGRYAGLISSSTFTLDGVQWNVSNNHPTGTKDGGTNGWGRMTFDVAAHKKDSITFVVFDRKLNGFPGVAVSSLTHTVTPYAWHIAYGVTPVGRRMPVSISNQVYWNLDGFQYGDGTIKEHELRLPFSGLRIETDGHGVPTGDLKGNTLNAEYDFWSTTSNSTIDQRLSLKGQHRSNSDDKAAGIKQFDMDARNQLVGYDDTFLVSRSQPWTKGESPVASLFSKRSGIKMQLSTDQEALRVLTWNEHNGSIPLKSTQKRPEGQDNPVGVPNLGGISLQMQDWTDAVNHPEWQRDDKIFWGTNELYVMYATYRFSYGRCS